MPTVTTGIFFVRKSAAIDAGRDENGFRLKLRLLDKQGPGLAEPYVVTWRGEPAESWFSLHGSQLRPGTPLDLELLNPRSFPTPMGPETHAAVVRLALAPVAPSWTAVHPRSEFACQN